MQVRTGGWVLGRAQHAEAIVLVFVPSMIHNGY
jgi:hypothetical protein